MVLVKLICPLMLVALKSIGCDTIKTTPRMLVNPKSHIAYIIIQELKSRNKDMDAAR